MLEKIEKTVLGMSMLRLLSGTIEISAALLMLKLNDIDKALIVNSSLALIGPIILISTTTVGLLGLADEISFSKIFWIFAGVTLILFGIKGN